MKITLRFVKTGRRGLVEKGLSMAGQRVGDLNGKWAFLFKTGVVILPIINACFLPWAIWVTTTLWDCSAAVRDGDKVISRIDGLCNEHKTDMEFMRASLKEMDFRFDSLPPQVWKDKITMMEADMRKNGEDHSKILVALEAIKQRLGVQPDVASDK